MSARTVLKHVLRPADGVAVIDLPQTSVVRHVGYDPNNLLAMWIDQPVAVPAQETTPRRFHIIGTGTGVPAATANRYIGTAAQPGQAMVWHVYEER